MRTIIGVCLDESGSMGDGGKRAAAISAFNEFLADQQRLTVDECLFAVAAFNHKARIMQPMVPVADTAPLTSATYTPNGSTALFDAIAYTVKEIERGIRDDDRVVCVILTDGEENASRETTLDQVKELIAQREAGRWNFVYLSASPDAFADGTRLGVAMGNVGQFTNSGAGYRGAVAMASAGVGAYRAQGHAKEGNFAAGLHTSVPPSSASTSAPDADDMWDPSA